MWFKKLVCYFTIVYFIGMAIAFVGLNVLAFWMFFYT